MIIGDCLNGRFFKGINHYSLIDFQFSTDFFLPLTPTC
jgi:hypothetical protein